MLSLFKKKSPSVNLRPSGPRQTSPWIIVVILLLAVLIAKEFGFGLHNISGYFGKEDSASVIAKVETHYLFPQGEVPTIATVVDPKQLEGQPFFERAEKGDKVLVFRTAKRAVLYRPSIDRVIEIMPLDPGEDSLAGSAQ